MVFSQQDNHVLAMFVNDTYVRWNTAIEGFAEVVCETLRVRDAHLIMSASAEGDWAWWVYDFGGWWLCVAIRLDAVSRASVYITPKNRRGISYTIGSVNEPAALTALADETVQRFSEVLRTSHQVA